MLILDLLNMDQCHLSESSMSEASVLNIGLNFLFAKYRMQKYGQLNLMAFKQEDLWGNANEQISWHAKLDGEEAIQKRVHE